MGISRIDQPEKHNHGYYVRISRNGKSQAKFFADKSNGGKRAAHRAAKEFEARLILEAESDTRKRPVKKSRRNTSGKVGVSRTSWQNGEREIIYWQACWIGSDGKRKSRKFSVDKYGEDKARRLAMKARREGVSA